MSATRRLIVGISGATGVVYAVRLLEVLRDLEIETHLVVTKAGELAAAYECDRSIRQIKALATVVHPIGDVGASIASGSYKTRGMIVAPCSMRSVAEIATGATSNLLTRSADVCLKERRRLVLLAREAPLHAGHLKAMLAVTANGGTYSHRFLPFTLVRPLSRTWSTIRWAASSIFLSWMLDSAVDGTDPWPTTWS